VHRKGKDFEAKKDGTGSPSLLLCDVALLRGLPLGGRRLKSTEPAGARAFADGDCSSYQNSELRACKGVRRLREAVSKLQRCSSLAHTPSGMLRGIVSEVTQAERWSGALERK